MRRGRRRWPGRSSHEPAAFIGIGAELFEPLAHGRVHFDDLAIDGAIEVADRFDGFDFAEGFAPLHFAADFGQIDEDQVGEGFQGEVGDSDGRDLSAAGVGFQADPFVGLGIEKILRAPYLASFRGTSVKRKLYHASRLQATPDVHVQLGSRLGELGKNIGHRNGFS